MRRTTAKKTGAATARDYIHKGWRVVPVPHMEKGCKLKGWPALRIDEVDIDKHFSDDPMNVAVLMGESSGWLVDVDLDDSTCAKLAPRFLPPTLMFGRPSKPNSHWLYIAKGAKTTQFKDEDGKMLVEIRSTKAATVFPGSTHEMGEAIAWSTPTIEPTPISADQLRVQVANLAAATLLANAWPAKGSRHNLALAIAGGLLRAGWEVDDVSAFLTAVAGAAEDEEDAARGSLARGTYERIERAEPTTGWPAAAAIVGDAVIGLVTSYLGIASGPKGGRARAEGEFNRLERLCEGVDLFVDSADNAHVMVEVDKRRETYRITPNGPCGAWLRGLFKGKYGHLPRSSTIKEMTDALDSEARAKRDVRDVFVRVGHPPDRSARFLTVGSPDEGAIEITSGGWSPVRAVPIAFPLIGLAKALPMPKRGGTLDLLDKHIPHASPDELALIKAWAVACFVLTDAPIPLMPEFRVSGHGGRWNGSMIVHSSRTHV